jgi:glycosyltransferase involved in cell wall biosynthesis
VGTATRLDPLRVTIVNGHGIVGGAETSLLRVLDGTDRLDARAVLLQDGPLRAELEARGVPVTVRETGAGGPDVIAAAAGIARALRRDRPDIVLANGVKAAAAAIPAGRIAGVRVVWAKHDYFRDAPLGRLLARWADGLVAPSAGLAEAVSRPDAFIVPGPRPAEPPADRGDALAFWRVRGIVVNEAPTAVMVTRLIPYKGVDDAIAALARPAACRWRLAIIGTDDPSSPQEGERLRALTHQLGVADRVIWVGYVENAGHWLAPFDALLSLIKPDAGGGPGREGFGLVPLEALLSGVPVVATPGVPLDGVEEAVVRVPPADPARIPAALEACLQLRDAAGREAIRIERELPDASHYADLVVCALSRVAGRPGAGRSGGPPVSVVTTVFNEGAAADQLVRAVSAQMEPGDELVIVDGGSTDDTQSRMRAAAARDSRIHFYEQPGATIAQGRNIAIAAARHSVFALTDAGCSPTTTWVAALRAPFAEPDPPSLVTGVYRVQRRGVLDGAVIASHYPVPEEARWPGPLVRTYGTFLGHVFDPQLPTGRSMAATTDAWRAAGGFAETEAEVVFGRAVARAGGVCTLAVDAEVEWKARSSLRATARMFVRHGYGDGLSGDRFLVARNLARVAAYVGGPALWLTGRRDVRAGVLIGAAAYLSLPLARARHDEQPLLCAAAVPAVLATKDIAKAVGCLRGLAGRRGGPVALSDRGAKGSS